MKYLKLFLCNIILMYNVQVASYHNNIFEVSVPKSGTHLLLKLLQKVIKKPNVLGMHFAGKSRYIICNHEYADQKNIAIFKRYNYRGIFIYRDPRDIIVSAANFTNRFRRDRGLKEYPMNDLIEHFIENKPNNPYPESLSFFESDITTMFQKRIGWKNVPFVYTTTFEKLVGLKGGGSHEEQIQEIKNIMNHLKITLSDEMIENLSQSLHGRWTFHEGVIGKWKEVFTEYHKELFKLKAGQLLIDLGYEKDNNW